MELFDYVRLLRRRWRLLAACVLVAGVIAWVTTPANPSNRQVTWQATYTMLRDAAAATPPPALAQVALFVNTGDVPKRVAERIGFDGSATALANRIDVEPDDLSGALYITASAATRAEAAELANAFGDETLAYFGEQARNAQRDTIEAADAEVERLAAEIETIEDELDEAEANGEPTGVLDARRDARIGDYARALDEQRQAHDQPPPSAGYLTLERASAEAAQTKGGGFEAPRTRLGRTAIALVLGLLLGVAVVLIAERFDPRLHTRENVEEAFKLPVVSEVPRVPGGTHGQPILSVTDPMSSVAEAYRALRAAVLLTPVSQLGARRGQANGAGGEPQVVLVTSPAPGEGKTTTVANLAAVFAETGRSVLVMSCDFRRPQIHKYFDVADRPGLSEVFTGARDLEDVIQPTAFNGVYLLPSGSGLRNLGDLANAGRSVLERARDFADIVVVDTAPVLATTDASELIPAVDAVVLVCRSGSTTAEGARRTRTLLERLSTPVVGVALIGAPETESSYSSYYTSKTPATAPARPKISLRRSIRAPELDQRLAPWGASRPTPPRESPRGHGRDAGPSGPGGSISG